MEFTIRMGWNIERIEAGLLFPTCLLFPKFLFVLTVNSTRNRSKTGRIYYVYPPSNINRRTLNDAGGIRFL
jgi:hypothetical protein